jgi:hypothetical protein
MALIECPECHKEVSSKATACPHCGHPIAAAKGAKPRGGGEHGCLITVLLLIGFAALLAIFGGKEETSENREKVTPDAPRIAQSAKVPFAERPERKAFLKEFCAAAETQTVEQQAAADAKETMRRMVENVPANIQMQIQLAKEWAEVRRHSTLFVETNRLWCHPTAPSEPTQFPTFKGWRPGSDVERAQQKWEQTTSETVRSTCERETEIYAKHTLRSFELGAITIQPG